MLKLRIKSKGIFTPTRINIRTIVNKNELEINRELDGILNNFKAPIRFACGYGSGVFKQLGYDNNDKPQVDMIFGVTHPEHWHSQNFKQNSHHYSNMRLLGSGFVSYVQEHFGAGIYYNPYCTINGFKVKYGVVSVEKLVKDLIDWDTLYLAGRMQKPLRVLKDDPHVRIANQINRSHALRASLLMLPETFTLDELLTVLVGISYMGDFRVGIGENPNKVANIVKAQRTYLCQIYNPVIDAFPALRRDGDVITQNMDKDSAAKLVSRLPTKLNKVLRDEYTILTKTPQFQPVSYNRNPELSKATAQALTLVVKESALTQSVKGLFTAGLSRSFQYITEKLAKRFKK